MGPDAGRDNHGARSQSNRSPKGRSGSAGGRDSPQVAADLHATPCDVQGPKLGTGSEEQERLSGHGTGLGKAGAGRPMPVAETSPKSRQTQEQRWYFMLPDVVAH